MTVTEFARKGGQASALKLSAAKRMAISKKAIRALKKKARNRLAGLAMKRGKSVEF